MSAFPLPHWAKRTPVAWSLLPLALIFGAVTAMRRLLYRFGVLRSQQLAVPVVVVGNIHVGGVGKTPVVMYLARALQQAGHRPGIISRGYGRSGNTLLALGPHSTAETAGDEPLLLYMKTHCPLVVGADRVAAGRLLLQLNPDVDVLICDDGLQHYRLQRDVELCVLDGFRGWGNRWLLPAGPLREGLGRLLGTDALIVHGDAQRLPGLPPLKPRFHMHLAAAPLYQLQRPDVAIAVDALSGRRILALTGIGDPQRFFCAASSLGLTFETRIFPDHHRFCRQDLQTDADIILMTEKDAVKCRGLDDGKIHVLPVSAIIDPDLGDWLLNHLRLDHGRQTA